MAAEKNSIWRAFAYMRLSKDDGVEKENGGTPNPFNSEDEKKSVDRPCVPVKESNSITNQRKLIQEYVRLSEDICLVGEFCDDGYTGTNFDRDGFQDMMKALKEGKADCVIVKDLSRLGREYIETGRYSEKIFPEMGVRFISINEHIDTMNNDQTSSFMIPFLNLFNDSYCRDISNKLRNQFRVQRQNGEFIGNFAFYGYKKSKEDKHKLVVDEPAAETVRMIFAMKINGYSTQNIANHLNQYGIPSPCEYKKINGSNYACAFQEHSQSRWSAVTVKRILENRIFIGYLEQGKRGTPNYKIKKMMAKDEKEWIVVKDAHEAIIPKEVFSVVQKLLERETQTPPGSDTVYPLSGMFFCGDCHYSMTRCQAKREGKNYNYYICSGNKRGKGCTCNHSIDVEGMHEKVLNAIKLQISMVVEMDVLMRELGSRKIIDAKMRQLEELMEQNRKQLKRQQDFSMNLYENKVDGLITQEEYLSMKKKYADKIEALQKTLEDMEKERTSMEECSELNCSWMQQFMENRNVTKLSRQLVATLIDEIVIYKDRSIEITFHFRNEFEQMQENLAKAAEAAQKGEALKDA